MENESSEIRRRGKGGGRKIGSQDGVSVDGSKIAKLRVEKGLTQVELGELAGISKGFLSSVERSKSKISPMYLERLVTALGLSLSELLGNSQEGSKKVLVDNQEGFKKEVSDLDDLEKTLATLRSALNLSAQAVSISLEIIEGLLQDLSRERR